MDVARTTETMTISLPPAFRQQLERVRKEEHRTRSELVREALRVYFNNRHPVVEPTKAELAAIRRSRQDIADGDFVTLDQLHDDLATQTSKTRRKSPRKTSG